MDASSIYMLHRLLHSADSTPWRNGSASDSRSEGCVFKSRRGQCGSFVFFSFFFVTKKLPWMHLNAQCYIYRCNKYNEMHVCFTIVTNVHTLRWLGLATKGALYFQISAILLIPCHRSKSYHPASRI